MQYISNINKTGNISTYIAALRFVRLSTVAFEKQYVSVALVIQHVTRMRCVILLSVACLALPHFSILSQTARFSGGGGLLNMKRVLNFLYKFCPQHFSF
jgi:hypothetical protein